MTRPMHKKDLVLATTNKNKLEEIRHVMAGLPYRLLSLSDLNIDIEIVEDGETFEANATKKAATIRDICGLTTIADDSGLVIDHLNGEPGVDSALYLGVNASYQERFDHILSSMADVHGAGRSARFVCVMAIAPVGGEVELVRAEVEGLIFNEPRGSMGHGYDPIFYFPKLNKTFAELSMEEKNEHSHRGLAMAMALQKLKSL